MLKRTTLCSLLALALPWTMQAQTGIMLPSGEGGGQTRAALPGPACNNGIDYHSGPIIADPHVYFIWYGNWGGNTATSILPDMISNLSGSRYFDTNSTYFQDNCPTGQTLLNRVSLNGQFFDSYSQGAALTDSSLQTVVSQAIGNGSLPLDSSGVYFVLSSTDVDETSGFCTRYCGFHSRATLFNTDIKYSFVGNVDRCPSACEFQTTSPNGNSGADGMANVLAHELNETVTDPDLNAWFSGSLSGEVGDLCNFNFGPTFVVPNGSRANVTLGARNFLLQQNWVNFNGGFCGLAVGVPPPLNGAFVEQQYLDFLDRAADPAGFNFYTSGLNNGLTRAGMIQSVTGSQEFSVKGKLVASAYLGLLARDAEYGGFHFWANALDQGLSPVDLAGGFIGSQEFQDRFGSLTDDQFVTLMYNNVLLRQPDPGGLSFWVSQLNNGASRAQIALAFLQSAEFQNLAASQNRLTVSLLYFEMLRRAPDAGGFAFWLNQLNTGTPVTAIIDGFINSAEYAGRF